MNINKRMYFSVLSGLFLEYFDYTLYAFAIVYISKAFFPPENPKIAMVLSWLVFATSFLVRPFSSIILGHIADRTGRRVILICSIFFMCLSTCLIGLIPDYSKIGILSTLLLIMCRIIQGVSVSTEYSGSSIYLLETIDKHQGLNSGIITSATGFGMFAASLLFLFFGSYWRVGFISASIIVGILGFYSRLYMPETPEFLKLKNKNKIAKVPLIELVRKNFLKIILGIVFSAYVGIIIVSIELYLPSYLHLQFSISISRSLALSTYLIITEAILVIICGFVSDIIGKLKTLTIGTILMIFFCLPIFSLFHTNSIFIWYIAATMLAFLVAIIDGPIMAYLVSLFPTQVRYSGVSLCYNLGGAIFGGITPMILTLFGSKTKLPIVQTYIIVSAVIVIIMLVIYSVYIRVAKNRYDYLES